MDKFYTINNDWQVDDRRKLLARDMLNSEYGSHRFAFQLFAPALTFAQAGAAYRNFEDLSQSVSR